MPARTLLFVAPLVGMAAVVSAGDLFPYRARACRRCGIPCYDYAPLKLSPPDAAVSLPPIPLENRMPAPVSKPGATDVAVEEIKLYQLSRAGLQVDHCSISRVGVTLHQGGRWILNLRAVQNPAVLPPDKVAQATQFKRNRFFVTVRAWGAAAAADKPGPLDPAKSEFFILLPVEGFWIERGEIRDIRVEGHLDAVRQYFRVIDRVEFELRYE